MTFNILYNILLFALIDRFSVFNQPLNVNLPIFITSLNFVHAIDN